VSGEEKSTDRSHGAGKNAFASSRFSFDIAPQYRATKETALRRGPFQGYYREERYLCCVFCGRWSELGAKRTAESRRSGQRHVQGAEADHKGRDDRVAGHDPE